jgi:hypothetical protein
LRIQALQQRAQALLEQLDDLRSPDELGELLSGGSFLPFRTGILFVSLA